MELYDEVDRRRAARYARRMERIARKERRGKAIERIMELPMLVMWVALIYLFLFAGCLWASV